jgi:hypothetical protein
LTISDKLSDIVRVKYWEIIADNLSKADWNWGCVATVDSRGRTIFVAEARRDDGKRFNCPRNPRNLRGLMIFTFPPKEY